MLLDLSCSHHKSALVTRPERQPPGAEATWETPAAAANDTGRLRYPNTVWKRTASFNVLLADLLAPEGGGARSPPHADATPLVSWEGCCCSKGAPELPFVQLGWGGGLQGGNPALLRNLDQIVSGFQKSL